MKIINFCLGILSCILCFWYVDTLIPYQLCQLEHDSLFVLDAESFFHSFCTVGGFGGWLSAWGLQSFALPHVGSLIFILPALALGVVMYILLCRKGLAEVFVPLTAVPAACLLFSQLDYYYSWQGSVSTLLALSVLAWVDMIGRMKLKIALFSLLILPVFWLLGSAVTVYVLSGTVLFFSRKTWPYATLPLLICMLFAGMVAYKGLSDSLYISVSPEFYYSRQLEMPLYHWLATVSIVLLLVVGCNLHDCTSRWRNYWRYGFLGMIWLLNGSLFYHYEPLFRNQKNQTLWQLNHYSFMEDWDGIIKMFPPSQKISNLLYMNYLNRALAEKGVLVDSAFKYRPYGAASLLVAENNTGAVRMLLSDVQYTVGCIAESQHQAFEAQTALPGQYGIQTLMRLTKTNLIQGHYRVAGKYLALIGKSLTYKKWALYYRQFLYDDKAVEADKELGDKRRSYRQQNNFSMWRGWRADLEAVLEANPQNTKAAAYLGISLLLTKDMAGFVRFLDTYYGTEALPVLPAVFQQAVLVAYPDNGERWKSFGLSSQVTTDYDRFRNLYYQTKNSFNQKDQMAQSFGDSFWFYLMFVK
ncbi:DUF6057 family protein [Bacteroides helcogenes]|uniref:Transmembrane protein n=1 Tax=Bacteroides helcogenes (strain ATCC 35417 / DSM 20613 / JCM 6297 / CCUG 15421 / P 36-108) TaxID=693979 RepID=E6SV50_BACT6|nr:DUF6057 family protein [Bacteroides helcogenes]ADV43432.1 putative transmembrane protein [Bacteroides helcogenes P 36-108]MDY5238199.1 DUF6057 family protein [Bacteroides helcogenes]